ncbi:hypothetical protein ACRRTK_007803 [Alexandromys fortis]
MLLRALPRPLYGGFIRRGEWGAQLTGAMPVDVTLKTSLRQAMPRLAWSEHRHP